MSSGLQEKWDRAARFYDLLESGGQRRRATHKRTLFREMRGRSLFVAAGTGLDFEHFPPGLEIVAIDISSEMLRRALPRAAQYRGSLLLQQADVERLPFEAHSFDTAVTSSTFCTVPDPIKGFCELFRVLKPGGSLLMFEHMRSQCRVLGPVLDLMTICSRLIGPEMNRRTIENAKRAGFQICGANSVYLDIFLAVRALKPANCCGA